MNLRLLASCAAGLLPLLVAGAALASADEPLLRYFTAGQVDLADDYVRPLYLRFVVEQAWAVLFVVLFLGLRWNQRLLQVCERAAGWLGGRLGGVRPLVRVGSAVRTLWGDASWAGAMLFVFAYVAIINLIDLPSSFYFGWMRERANGMSVQSLGHWSWDVAKAFLMTSVALGFLAFGLYGLARRRRNWWLLLGVPCAVLLLGAGMLDPYRVQVFRDYERLPEGPARDRISATLTQAGVEYEDVYALKMRDVSTRVNAFIAGQGPTRRIVVWDTLLAAMTPEEVANAVAHELGHLHDRSPGRLVLASVCLVPFLWLMAAFLRRLGATRRFGFESDRDVTSLPAVLLFATVLGMVAGPAANAFNRHQERRADRYALELLAQPEAYRSMMVKLARHNRADLHAPTWVKLILHSHPEAIERIRAAEDFAREKGIALALPTPALFASPVTASSRATSP